MTGRAIVARTTRPLLRSIYRRMMRQATRVEDIEHKSGVRRETVWTWLARDRDPLLSNIEAVVEALGGRLTIEWTDEAR